MGHKSSRVSIVHLSLWQWEPVRYLGEFTRTRGGCLRDVLMMLLIYLTYIKRPGLIDLFISPGRIGDECQLQLGETIYRGSLKISQDTPLKWLRSRGAENRYTEWKSAHPFNYSDPSWISKIPFLARPSTVQLDSLAPRSFDSYTLWDRRLEIPGLHKPTQWTSNEADCIMAAFWCIGSTEGKELFYGRYPHSRHPYCCTVVSRCAEEWCARCVSIVVRAEH
jgi:hypothetical protein